MFLRHIKGRPCAAKFSPLIDECFPEVTPEQWACLATTTAGDADSVVIFTSQGCPFCIRAKKLMHDKGWCFTEINLTEYPERRQDMLSAAGRATVPQIFVNGTHIGGCDDLFAANDAGTLEGPCDPEPQAPEALLPSEKSFDCADVGPAAISHSRRALSTGATSEEIFAAT
jgi:glutaredoxin 3